MLKLFHNLKGLNLSQLKDVYAESNLTNGKKRYPYLPENLQRLMAEQDFYNDLRLFLEEQGAICAVLAAGETYRAALRIEQYLDGFIITCLETAPEARNRGLATELVNKVLKMLSQQVGVKVYSHVDKKNAASIAVHTACGFTRIQEHAVYLDGSVLNSSCTFCYRSG